jgi:hypothetical protein
MSLCFRSGREIVKILESDLSSGQTQLLRFFLALLKNKIIFRSVPKCQYLSLTPEFQSLIILYFIIGEFQEEKSV